MVAIPSFPDLATLVVDESLHVRRTVRDMLLRVGIKRVLEAADGADALGVLPAKPDLTILDWNLAIVSGEEFLRLVRAPAAASAAMPVVLMLAQPRRTVVERAVALGVDAIVAKPFSPKTLWSRLAEVLDRPIAPGPPAATGPAPPAA